MQEHPIFLPRMRPSVIISDITTDDIISAAFQAKKLGILNNSIMSGKGNLVGCIGEIIVAKYLGVPLQHSYDYDLIWNGLKIDVKTKLTSVFPKPSYECSIASANPNQKCDWYIFTRVHSDLDTAYILGYLPKEEYFKTAECLHQGQVSGSNGFTVKHNCYNVSISELKQIPM